MADSLDAWIARRLESYAQKHELECNIAEPGKLVQVHKWLTFESPYWATVGDSELSILAVFSDESALKHQTQTGRSITSLRRAVLRLTSIKPTLKLPFAKAQTRDIAFDVSAFTVMNSGGEHEPIYYDRVKDASRELSRGQLKDWIDGLKRKYNQIGLVPIQMSSNVNPTEPLVSTRPAPTHVQPSSSIESPAPTSLPPPPTPASLPSSSAAPSESKLSLSRGKPTDILDLSWWIISPDQQILLDAIGEPSRLRPSPSWSSTASHPTQLSQATPLLASIPKKSNPPISTATPSAVDQDSEEELSIRKPRAIGTNAGTIKKSLLQPAQVQRVSSTPETALQTEPVLSSLSTPPPLKPAPPMPAPMDVDMAAIVTMGVNKDAGTAQDRVDMTQSKGSEREESLVASQSQTITHSSPSSVRPSLPPSLSQPQSESRSSPQQHESNPISLRPSSTAPSQHIALPLSEKPDGILRTAEVQDGKKKPLGRASSTVLVPNSDTDSVSRSQSLPLSWPLTEPPSSQPSQIRPPDRLRSLSPSRLLTQPSVAGSQTQPASQTQTHSPSQPAEKTVLPTIDLHPAQVPDQISSVPETRVEPTTTTPAITSAPIPTITNTNSGKRQVPDEFLVNQNDPKKAKTAPPIAESTHDQKRAQKQRQIDKKAAAATNTTTASSKTWSTVPMLRTGQPTYPDHPSDSQPTQARGSETIEFSQMPDTQQRETVRAALAQDRSNLPQPSTTPSILPMATGSSRPVVPLSAKINQYNEETRDGKQTSGGGELTSKSASARFVGGVSSSQCPRLASSPAPVTTSASASTPTIVPVTLLTLASVPAPAPVPTSAPGLPFARPARKVFKLRRTLPLSPGLPSEAEILLLLQEAKKWTSSKQTDQTVQKKTG